MLDLYICNDCGEVKEHPSMLRSIPWCEACEKPMLRVPDNDEGEDA